MTPLLLCPPPAVQQVDEDRRRREVGGRTRIVGVSVVAQRPVERSHQAPTARGAYPAGVDRPARPTADLGSGLETELSRDVGVRPGGEQDEVGLHHCVLPRQAARPRPGECRRADLERGREVGRVLPRHRVALRGERHRRLKRDTRYLVHVLGGHAAEPGRARTEDRGEKVGRVGDSGACQDTGDGGAERREA